MRHPEGETVTIYLHCENQPDWKNHLEETWSAKCIVFNGETKCYDETLLDRDQCENHACNGT